MPLLRLVMHSLHAPRWLFFNACVLSPGVYAIAGLKTLHNWHRLFPSLSRHARVRANLPVRCCTEKAASHYHKKRVLRLKDVPAATLTATRVLH